jgi:hypothetical protein
VQPADQEGVGLEALADISEVLASGRRRVCQQPRHAHQVVRAGHQIARQLRPSQSAVTRPTEATDRLQPAKYLLNGLFTNDKFCWSRPARLYLKWWHRAYRDR